MRQARHDLLLDIVVEVRPWLATGWWSERKERCKIPRCHGGCYAPRGKGVIVVRDPFCKECGILLLFITAEPDVRNSSEFMALACGRVIHVEFVGHIERCTFSLRDWTTLWTKRETDQWHVEVARAAAVSSSGRAEVLVMTSRTVRREWKPTQRLRRDGMHI